MAKEFTIPASLIPKLWASKVWREGNKASYFDKFTSTDGSKPVQVNKDLKRAKGNTVYFGIAMNLTGDGVTGDNTLVNNEDTLTMHDFSVTTSQVRNAVARYTSQDHKSPYENLALIKSTLVQWVSDWKDDTLISKLTADPTDGEFLSAASAGTEAAIAATDKLTCDLISKAKRKAMLHAPKIKPIKIDGQDKYIMLVGPLAARDLKSDEKWFNSQKDANVRGSNNPIFNGALGEYDGVVLYEYERVQTTKTGASSANVVHNLLLGQQAACYAVTREPEAIKQVDDYGNREGNGISFDAGIAKVVFNSHDYGVLQVMTGGAAD